MFLASTDEEAEASKRLDYFKHVRARDIILHQLDQLSHFFTRCTVAQFNFYLIR